MITAVDTNVLLDVLGADPTFGLRSRDTIATCLAEGTVVACDVVWAEVASAFPVLEAAQNALQELQVSFSPLVLQTALHAGLAWRRYRSRGGSRQRMVPDFLIGAHASRQADRLLTRDRGFYRSYFGKLAILDPAQR